MPRGEIPSCVHCGECIMRGDVVRAVYSVVALHPVIGIFSETRGEALYICRDCFDDMAGLTYLYDPRDDKLVVTNPRISVGQESSPRACAACACDLEVRDAIWTVTYGDLDVSPRKGVVFEETRESSDAPFPDTHICTTCADTYVYGEG